METAHMMPVKARSACYLGYGISPHYKQQHDQKESALFEAINNENLPAAREVFESLVNLDGYALVDAQWGRLSIFLEAGNIYLAQQLVQEIKSVWVNSQPLSPREKPHF